MFLRRLNGVLGPFGQCQNIHSDYWLSAWNIYFVNKSPRLNTLCFYALHLSRGISVWEAHISWPKLYHTNFLHISLFHIFSCEFHEYVLSTPDELHVVTYCSWHTVSIRVHAWSLFAPTHCTCYQAMHYHVFFLLTCLYFYLWRSHKGQIFWHNRRDGVGRETWGHIIFVL